MPVFRALLVSLMIAVSASAETIRVGAAISLKEALGAVAKKYEAATGEKVEFTFGASGQILTQIKGGADVDLFVSAANKQVDDLQKDGLIDAGTRRVVVTNTLVLVVPADAKSPPADFAALAGAGVTQVAIGAPKTVPAGQYAEQVFTSLKLTETLAGKLVYGTNVRQVLTYVETGEVSAGVVYATDALESGAKVRVVATADEKTHEPIVYPAVILAASKKHAAAQQFLDYLTADEARNEFKAKGFGVPAPAEPATKPAEK